ncbi:uncharacterized protein BN670_00066 [Clostridium sp. CAG:470]|nr:MAG: hypothetical protein BHW03_04655 [Clostridium sp. 28_17]CDE15240.1 uncharacterized protein BN670_00066 [Clostridium sp. CAG:470]
MKKLLFGAYSLDIGGIEKALVILVNKLQEKGYDITLVLEKKQGIFLNEIDPKIKIIEYAPSNSKNKIQRKIINLIKRIKFTLKYKNKYDFSASFATYSLPASFIARTASKNCYLWGHADYLTLFDGNAEKMKEFFIERNFDKFKKIIFVSKEGKDSFIKVFPEMKEKTMVCNNLIDANKILELSKEKIPEEDLSKINKLENTKKETTIFINVGRHQEKQKKLSRLIEAATMLKKDNMNFKIIFIGDGPETEEYKKQVKNNQLENNIIFLGKKQNPYPYFKIADCVVLTSDYEGYPVVFLESFILEKPIITTKVSDYKEVENKYGFVTEKDTKDIYEKMKNFILNGFEIKEKFDYKKYNEEILKKIEDLF